MPEGQFIANHLLRKLFAGFFNGDGDRDGHTNHRIISSSNQAHHFYVGGDGGGAGELGVGVHSTHGVGHAVGGGAGCHRLFSGSGCRGQDCLSVKVSACQCFAHLPFLDLTLLRL